MKEKRIEILDSFRFVAIISVIFFHYTYRWTVPYNSTNLYPYGDFFGNSFRYGNNGVQFFFIISGFVISYTLENTSDLSAFFKNRFIRLFPPILFWSIITYLVFIILDNAHLFSTSHQLKNFLPSLTFINPKIWETIFKTKFDWLNGSYWSLWIEVQFYFISSILFFINKKNFFRNILVLTVIMILQNYILIHFLPSKRIELLSPTLFSFVSSWSYANQVVNIASYIAFFTMGVIFHHLYKRYPISLRSLAGLCAVFIPVYILFSGIIIEARIIYFVMITLFLLMIYKRSYLSFLENPLFRRIGVISYSVYLAHEHIGVLLINKYGGYLGNWSPLCVLIMPVLIILSAELSYRLVEQKVARQLKKLLFKPRRPESTLVQSQATR
ncbi:MAG TPA: acyltransferase [Puia sp.]|nr:acyltransferase [Puia sp.]